MDTKKEFDCLEKSCRIYSKSIDIEGDYQESLPAYLDDIYRVVKCTSNSYVTSADINFNEVRIYGKCCIQITYYNESSRLCFADFEEDFSKTFSLDNLTDSSFVRAVICDKYTNFRVINQRRIDIHTMAVLGVSVYDKVKCPSLRYLESSKLKTQTLDTADVIGAYIDKIDFDEEVTLPADSKAVGRIISSTSNPSVTDVKVIKDKALVKVNLNTTVLYTADSEEEDIEKAEYNFALSKIIDINGLTDDDVVIADVTPGSIFFKVKGSANEQASLINVFGDLSVVLTVIRRSECDLVVDGYALGTSSQCEYTDFTVNTNGRLISENRSVDVTLPFNTEISEIKDLSLKLKTPVFKNGSAAVTLDAVAIIKNDSGLSSVSATADVEIRLDSADDAIISVGIENYDYTLSSDGNVNVRLNLNVNAFCFDESETPVLADMTLGEEVPKQHTLTVYFGKENEKVWDIAKMFLSDENEIIKENALGGDTLDSSRVLIIPKA